MAELLTNTTIQDNSDLDRVADLLKDYTIDTEKKYEELNKISKFHFNISYLLFVCLIVMTIFTVYNISHLITITESIIFFVYVMLVAFLGLYIWNSNPKDRKNKTELIDSLQISRKRLSEVMKFASQYLENKELTDIRRFELKLLLSEADAIYLKTEKYV